MRAAIAGAVWAGVGAASASGIGHLDALPSYHYGAPIPVQCMNRSSETGEHIENDKHELQWVPFPECKETGRPLEFHYGTEGEVNCTIASVSDALFHQLEFYIHSDAPLACRIPARPAAHVEIVNEAPPAQPFIPLVFAMAGTLQLSHLHISTRLNVLLHSVPKHHTRTHDSGVLDSATAYSTSPLGEQTRLIVGDALPLRLAVRWFPTPALPRTEGRVEWQGLRGGVDRTLGYCVVAFVVGAVVAGGYVMRVVLPKRMTRGMGGATPLGYGMHIGNGWGYAKRKD